MENLSLNAVKREKKTKGYLNSLRKSGRVPAVLYGLNADPENISINARELSKFLTSNSRNQIINLQIGDKSQLVLIKEVLRHAIKQTIVTHLDFIRVKKSRPVIINVPIKHVGTASGVKNEGGLFTVMKRFVKVKCNPEDIPIEFVQDVTDLTAGSIVYAGDINFPQGTILTPAKTALFGVTSPKAEVEETPTTEPEGDTESVKEGEEGSKEEAGGKAEDKEKGKKEAEAKT